MPVDRSTFRIDTVVPIVGFVGQLLEGVLNENRACRLLATFGTTARARRAFDCTTPAALGRDMQKLSAYHQCTRACISSAAQDAVEVLYKAYVQA
jgi:hypothetical protein